MPEQLVAAWNAGESITSVEQAVNLDGSHKIAKLQRVDEAKVYKSIGRLLARMVIELHISDGLSTANIKNIAKRLTTDDEIRWWLTLADIDLLCRQIVEGKFGKFFGHFGEGEFYSCMTKYCNERNEVHLRENQESKPNPSAVKEAVGYTIDKDGRISVKNKKPQPKRPMRYLYDEKGNIKSENPNFWGVIHAEKNAEEMKKINRQNRVMERVRILMKENPSIGYVNAANQAIKEVEEQEAQENEQPPEQ